VLPQIGELPEIVPGCAGALPGIRAIVCAIELPQEEVAVREMVPPVLVGVAVIELEVEVPVHPEGNVQL
jgi:hypothetical protein